MLSILQQILLGLALAMDCFSVSIATGITLKRFVPRAMLTMIFCFGLFQALMPFIGWIGTVYFNTYIQTFDHWIAFGLLTIIGGNMIINQFRKKDNPSFNPNKLATILLLSIATSIDALTIGISFTCMGLQKISEIITPILIIGFISSLMSAIGCTIGIYIGKRFRFPSELVGGVILTLIGVKVLIDHLS